MTRTRLGLAAIAAALLAGTSMAADPPPPDVPALIAANSRPFAFADGALKQSLC